jgi:hypothetical protein
VTSGTTTEQRAAMVFAQEIKTSIAIFFNGYKNKVF